MHPTNAGELFIEGSEQGLSGPRKNKIYISIIWNFFFCPFDKCQNVKNANRPYPDRQHVSFELFSENVKVKESRTKFGSFYLGSGSRLLLNIYQGFSVAMSIGNLGTRKIPRNGNGTL